MAGDKCSNKEWCKNICPEGRFGECGVITQRKEEEARMKLAIANGDAYLG